MKWRQRGGVGGREQLLQEAVAAAPREAGLTPPEVKRVHGDPTVQEKARAVAAAARRSHKARQAGGRVARSCNFQLRQSYGRLGAARHLTRARRATRKLRTYVGRGKLELSGRRTPVVRVAQRLSARQRPAHRKAYRVHAPGVGCSAEGKVAKHSEFGGKVRSVTPPRRGWRGGIDAEHGNPSEGATVKPALAQVKRVPGTRPEEAVVDKGVRGQRYHPKGGGVYVAGRKNPPQLRKPPKRRSAIGPVIGHTTHDHGLDRN